MLLAFGLEPTADHEGFTPLIHACFERHLPTIEFLIRHGADVNAVSQNGKTALSEIVHGEVDDNSVACLRALLRAGANPVEGDVIDAMESRATWARSRELAEELTRMAAECRERAARLGW